MTTVAERLTADEYDDPRRSGLVDGALVVNEPTDLHQRVVGLIYAALLARCWSTAAGGRPAASTCSSS